MRSELGCTAIAAAYSVRGNADATASTPTRRDEIATVEPRDFTIATVPARDADFGDLYAGVDDAVFDLAPLLEGAERDECDGADETADPDDS